MITHTRIDSSSAHFASELQPGGEELLARIGSHRPYLSPTLFDGFADMTVEYLGQFPAVGPNSDANEAVIGVEKSLYATVAEEFIADHEQEHLEALEAPEALHTTLTTMIRNEFTASGVDASGELYDQAMETLAGITENAQYQLAEKSRKYKTLMSWFMGNTANISEELSDRMEEALTQLSEDVIASGEMPDTPRQSRLTRFAIEKLMGRVSDEQAYEMFNVSKQKVLDSAKPPSREKLTSDFINGASAWYLRTLYGFRELVLDQGFRSDSTEQIDAFQRRYYDELGGYKIAQSPAEWVESYMRGKVNELLYGDTEVSQALDAAGAGSFAYGRRAHRKSASGYSQQKATAQEESVGSEEESGYTYQSHGEDQQPETTLTTPQRQVLGDVVLLIDSYDASGYITQKFRSDLIKAATETIQELWSSQADTPNIKAVVKRMMVRLHPDTSAGDLELSKHVTGMYNSLKRS